MDYCSLLRRRVAGEICRWPAEREWIANEVMIITQATKSPVTLLQHLHTIKSRRELCIKQRFHYAPRLFSWVTISSYFQLFAHKSSQELVQMLWLAVRDRAKTLVLARSRGANGMFSNGHVILSPSPASHSSNLKTCSSACITVPSSRI